MSVTLVSVLVAARARVAPLVGEMAGYLVLGVADQVAVAPRRVAGRDVSLREDGSVRIEGGVAASDEEAEGSLRQLLAQLLDVTRSATPAVVRASERRPGGGVGALVRELESGLIPVNRAAGRRALSRLFRETSRALESGVVKEPSEPEPEPEPVRPAAVEPASVPEPAAAVVAAAPPRSPLPAVMADTSPDDTPEIEVRLEDPDSPEPPLVLDEVTRPEPAVARARAVGAVAGADVAALPVVSSAATDVALTPAFGSVGVQCDDASAHATSTVLHFDEGENTDPMPQGAFDELSDDRAPSAPPPDVRTVKPPRALLCAVESPEPPEITLTEPSPEPPAVDEVEVSPAPMLLGAGSAVPPAIEVLAPWPGLDLSEPEPEPEPLPLSPSPVLAIVAEPSSAGEDEHDDEVGSEGAEPPVDEESSPVEAAPKPVDEPEPEPIGEPEPESAMGGAAEVVALDDVAEWADASFPPDDGWEEPEQAPPAPRAARSNVAPQRSNVADLLARFSVAGEQGESDLCQGLKQIAGVDATPLPAAVGHDD